jgi:hypothetical protein
MKKLLFPALAVLALSGCFGGGDDDTAPPPADPLAAVPDSASASSMGFIEYLKVLAANLTDSREPLDPGTFSPPKPDDTEPEAVS